MKKPYTQNFHHDPDHPEVGIWYHPTLSIHVTVRHGSNSYKVRWLTSSFAVRSEKYASEEYVIMKIQDLVSSGDICKKDDL